MTRNDRYERSAVIVALAAAVVITIATIAIVVAVVMAASGLAVGASMVQFDVCNISTGAQFKGKDGEASGVVWMVPESVVSMTGVVGRPCTMLRTDGGATIYVKGTVEDIACRINGGGDCGKVQPIR